MDIETASIIGKSASMIARDSIFEQEKPNPGRLRDHAKIFPHTRASTSNLYDAATGGSNRRTPVFCNDAFLSRLVIGPQTSPSISRINTPTTPRSRAGYMGKETYKAYNSIPRSASTGAVNSYNALYGFTSSAHVSPNPSLHFGESILTGTPKSHWSASMTGFPQSPADVAAAEHCMDEQLKALRRRSFATEAMNSPGGSVSLLESAQMNSPSLGTPHSELGSLYGVGRRRSSLGMSSMINSINKSHDDSDSASSSSYYSPIGSSATPHSASSSSRHSGEGDTDDHSSQYTQKHLDFAVSAQELLRAEYGDLYPVHPLSIENEQNEMENMNPDTHSIASSMGRPRSNSTSSTGTSRSNGTSVYSSINEQQQQQGHGSGRGAKQLGPPPSLMNKIRSNTNYPSSHKNHNTGQTTVKGGDLYSVVGKKSNSHPKNSKKFPSHGDLTRYSWDYRKEMPID
ncbi:hypothetical protein FBU30_006819 [Linnemannia zychae]|nr:hypothetical protein FBU30_006819 [Linnemannia zychae]